MKNRFRVGLQKPRRQRNRKQLLGLGASAVAVLGAGSAQAVIVSNQLDVTIGPTQNNLNLNLNLSNLVNSTVTNNDDFAFNTNINNDTSTGFVTTNLSFNSLNNASQAIFNPLNANALINSGSFGHGRSGMDFNLGTMVSNIGSSNTSGDWVGLSNVFLGLLIDVPGSSPHYGWLELDLAENLDLTVRRYAIETEANRGIRAGQTQSSPVAEPGSLALFALGALGVSAWRRRRHPAPAGKQHAGDLPG